MASAYAAFANNGAQYPLIEVKEIKNASTGFDWKPDAKPKQVLDPNVAETVTQTLTHVTNDSDGTAYGAQNYSGMQNIAGKTGTSTMDMDTLQKNYPDIYSKTQDGHFSTAAVWFNGYTSKLETAVAVSRWITEKDPKTGKSVQIQAPVDNINGAGFSFGASVSMPIWAEFMKLMQNTHSKFVGDPTFPTPNTASMTVSGSPAASASPSASATKAPNGNGQPSVSSSPSASPSSSASCQAGFLGGLAGGCGGNGGGGGSTPSMSPSPSPSTSRKHG
jgi:membrane peptidoglycan carboxypeptidase